MKIFDTRLQVWVFAPTKECPLTWADLLVYSNLAYQDRYGKRPNNSRIAWATGLSVDTVAKSLARLEEAGGYREGKPVERGWFYRKSETNVDHWSKRYVTWNCLVRAEGAPIKVPDVMIFSYLCCKQIEGFAPRDGWSAAYLATVLLMDRRTVAESLGRLEANQLFQKDEEGDWMVADALVGNQNEWFKTKAATEARVLKTFTPKPSIEPNEASSVQLDGGDLGTVLQYIGSKGGDVHLKEILRKVRQSVIMQPALVPGWRELVDKGINDVLGKKTANAVESVPGNA